MRNPAAISITILLSVIGLQTFRVFRINEQLLTSLDAQATAERHLEALKRHVLSEIVVSLQEATEKPADGVYLVVDRQCRACQDVLVTVSERELAQPVWITSFVDSADALRSWASVFGLDESVLSHEQINAGGSAAFVKHMSRTVTPVWIRLSSAMPLELMIGQPTPAWFK